MDQVSGERRSQPGVVADGPVCRGLCGAQPAPSRPAAKRKVRQKETMKSVSLRVIGTVKSSVEATVDRDWGKVKSRVEIKPEYRGGLKGLESFSHAIIITYLHKSQFDTSRDLQRRPRGMRTMPNVGIFSQRAKNRPNPIGVTAVKIVGVGEDYLEVLGLDAVNTTPVLDIKPYFREYDRIQKPVTPAWVQRLMKGYF